MGWIELSCGCLPVLAIGIFDLGPFCSPEKRSARSVGRHIGKAYYWHRHDAREPNRAERKSLFSFGTTPLRRYIFQRPPHCEFPRFMDPHVMLRKLNTISTLPICGQDRNVPQSQAKPVWHIHRSLTVKICTEPCAHRLLRAEPKTHINMGSLMGTRVSHMDPQVPL